MTDKTQATVAPAGKIDQQTQKELMRQAGIWIESSTLYEDDLPARELKAVQAEQHHLDLYTQLVAQRAALQAAPPAQARHSDVTAVDTLAAAIKAKLAQQRAKGHNSWDAPECTQQYLSNMLHAHVIKGDPVDVAIFCAFLDWRGEDIVPTLMPKTHHNFENNALT